MKVRQAQIGVHTYTRECFSIEQHRIRYCTGEFVDRLISLYITVAD